MMKIFYITATLLFLVSPAQAQILKKVSRQLKRDAEWRIRGKADQQIDRGIDSAMNMPKKIISGKQPKNNETNTPVQNQDNPADNPDNNITANTKSAKTPADDNDMSQKDGFINAELSASTVFTGGLLTISGKSVRYKNFTQVEVAVSGQGSKSVKQIALDQEGKFITGWYAPDQPGDYTVTVKGSDKKSAETYEVKVFGLPLLNNWCSENITLFNKAYDNLKAQVDEVKGSIGTKDKTDLDQKLSDIKEKVDAAIKLFTSLNAAGSETARVAKAGKNLPPNLSDNLSRLNDKLAEQRKKMQQLEEYNNHKPLDNTVCEYLVMVNEACAAFSLYTNLESRALTGIIKAITIDKGVPKYASMLNEKTTRISGPEDIVLKEPAKIFASSLIDAENFTSKLNTASFAGDMIQFATDVLMKKYCGVFKGSLQHDYKIEFRNNKGENWWTYGVKMKAALFLRYPKEKGNGRIIKMKGNLEGNGTGFSFFEDIEKEDGFYEGTKGKIEVVPIKTFTPLAVSEATSERDILGFGAIARGMATPAYFNIPVDAEYDVDAEKIKIFLNEPIIDFSEFVANQFVFLLVGGDLLPYVKHMRFPIHKANVTLGSVIRSNNEFTMDKDSKGNLSFNGKGNKHIGNKTSVRETDLNFTIAAKKE